MKKLSPDQAEALRSVAKKLGANPASLEALIRFETAGTFDPAIKNRGSSGRGLIQFVDATAKGMGYRDSLDLVEKFPTFEAQLYGPVYAYLSRYAPFKNDQALFMSVFYPAYRAEPVDKPFPLKVQQANPGIKTPEDYIRFVYKKARAAGGGGLVAVLLTAVTAGFFF